MGKFCGGFIMQIRLFGRYAIRNMNLCANFFKSCTQTYNFRVFWYPFIEGHIKLEIRNEGVRFADGFIDIQKRDDISRPLTWISLTPYFKSSAKRTRQFLISNFSFLIGNRRALRTGQTDRNDRFGNGDRRQRDPTLYSSDGIRTVCKRQQALRTLTSEQQRQSQGKARGAAKDFSLFVIHYSLFTLRIGREWGGFVPCS